MGVGMANAPDGLAIQRKLRQEFLDDAAERLRDMNGYVETARQKSSARKDSLAAFRRDLHTLKGQGGSFGFPSISEISHQFEDFLSQVGPEDFAQNRIVSKYLESMEMIIETGSEPAADDLGSILNSLSKFAQLAKTMAHQFNVILVCDSRTIRHMVGQEIKSYGFTVVSASDPFDAMRSIVEDNPDYAIFSATLGKLSGFDMIHALAAMPSTRHISTALLTSYERDHPAVQALPNNVAVISLGPRLSDELALALSGLEYKLLNTQKMSG